HGKLIVMALICYAGDDAAGGRGGGPPRGLAGAPADSVPAVAAARGVGGGGRGVGPPAGARAAPRADMVQPMPYAGLFEPAEDMEVVEESARSLFMDTVDAAAAASLLEALQCS